jgi:hypothetical protein
LSRGDNSLPPGLLFFAKMLRSTSLSHTCWISYFSIRLSHEGITGTVNGRRIDFTSTFNPTDSFFQKWGCLPMPSLVFTHPLFGTCLGSPISKISVPVLPELFFHAKAN